MKKILFLIPLLFVNLNLFAQYSFDLLIDQENDQEIYDVIETENSFVLVGANRSLNAEYSTGCIFEIMKDGEILQEKIFSNENGSYIFFNIHQIGGQYYILANKSDVINSRVDLALLQLDQDLVLQEEHLIGMPEGYWYSHMKSIIDSENNIVIAGYANTPDNNNGLRFDPCFNKLNLQGDSLNSKIMVDPDKIWRMIYDVLEKPDSSGYYAFGSFFDHLPGGEMLSVSKNLDSIQLDNLPMGIKMYYSVLPISDTSFAFCGRGTTPYQAEDEIAISISDYDMNSLYYQHSKKEENMEEQPSRLYGLKRNDDFIFMSSISNFNPVNPFFSESPSWYHLVKMDLELNIVWEKFFGGDVYYFPYSICATDDGGCIVVGNRYDGEIYRHRDIYIVKVNSEGLIVWTQEINMSKNKVKVSPNPGRDYLELHTAYFPASFQIYNLNGSVILEETIHSNVTRINTMELSAGTYIWSLLKDGKVVETGKWLKE